MIKIENIEIWGFEHAIRGMRNPLNSWSKSDSYYEEARLNQFGTVTTSERFKVGENDLDLMHRLYVAGQPHRKYLRQIFVSMDITAPLYWWKEFDTYKVGTTANSCSTMHKIHDKDFTLDDFSHEHLENLNDYGDDGYFLQWFEKIIYELNVARKRYLETKDKIYWWQMIQLLPSSYNQRRTITMNYENVVNIIQYRTGHKLDEWREFVDILGNLPYLAEITKGDNEDGTDVR